ncbi:MAG: TonB-dependent receptor [Bacteroidota bacterium]
MQVFLARFSAVILGIFLTASSLFAQRACTASLYGKTVDDHNGEPLSYSVISIAGTDKGAVTDENGAYRIEGICPGTYKVVCTHIGCDTLILRLKITGATRKDFFPEHHAEMLDDVSIVGRIPDAQSSRSETTLTEQELEESKGKTLGDLVKAVSGVTTINNGSSIAKPVIHGMHSNRVLILNNGVRQEGQQWGNEHGPEIDPFIADQLTVVKGANSVRYGTDAIAGVILVNPRPLRDSAGIGGEVNLVGFSNGRQGVVSAMVDGNFARVPALSWRAQGTFKRGGNVHAPTYFLDNSGIREYNFSLAGGYRTRKAGVEIFYSQFNTDIGIFTGAHIGNLTDLQRAFEAEEPLLPADFSYEIGRPYQRIEHELFKTEGYLRTGLLGKMTLTYARQYNLRLEYDKDEPRNDSIAALNRPELQFEITTHTANLAWEHYRRHGFKGTIGIAGIHQGNTYAGRYFIPNFLKSVAGIFITENWKLDSSRLELEAGARFDYVDQQAFRWENNVIVSPEFSYQNISWNVGAIYSLTDQLKVRFNAGSAWRPPGINELFSDGLHHGAAAVEIGDENLDPERSTSFSLSGEYQTERLQLNVDGYHHHFSNFVYLVPVLPPTLTIRGAFPTLHYKQLRAGLTGADFTLRWRITDRVNWTSKASMLRARNLDTEEFLVQMPADRFENTFEYRFKDGKFWRNGYISGTVLGVLRQWRVPPNSDFAPPPAGYTLLGLQLGFDVPVGQQAITCGVGMSNLLNASYRDYLNRFRYYTNEMGRNISFRLTVPFAILRPKTKSQLSPLPSKSISHLTQ